MNIDAMSISEARCFLSEGHFAPGSMRPKVEAAISFVEKGGNKAVICSIDNLAAAVNGCAGTEIAA